MHRRPPRRALLNREPAAFLRRPARGAAAVELALILPVVLMLIFGLTTAGLSLAHAIGLSNAVREGSRFGATAHPGGASLPFTPAQWTTWGTDTIARVRGTQFDDSGTTTAVCVDMYKVGTGSISGSMLCNQGNGSVQPPLDVTKAPTVGNDLGVGNCVVRVWSARPFEVNLVVTPVRAGYVRRSSVARFETRTTEKCP